MRNTKPAERWRCSAVVGLVMAASVAAAASHPALARLVGAPARGPLFDFAPAIDTYLETQLFGDIFGRDNLDWTSRELATVGALAAMSGVESQLQSHIRISLNVGLTATQLRQVADALAAEGMTDAAQRTRSAIGRVLADPGAAR